MRKSRRTEEQIAMALRQGEAGTPIEEIYRKMGIAEATYFRWKKKYGFRSSSRTSRSSKMRKYLDYQLIRTLWSDLVVLLQTVLAGLFRSLVPPYWMEDSTNHPKSPIQR
jgi:transposase-like protein